MLRCGKHAGAHFHDVAATDKQYCGWVLRERAEGRALPRDLKQFASYLRREHGGVVAVGKHRGSFFDDVLRDDEDYCGWVCSLENPSKPMAEFAKYVKEHGERSRKRRREGGDMCAICFDASVDTAFVPCGHMTACLDCARRVHQSGRCPICREPIVDILQTFCCAAASSADV